ncbi:MAG: DUF3500 domain-containing protein [Opitutus sp.]|nr:DUF3500 domain-containing protein [Opitutus sp.]
MRSKIILLALPALAAALPLVALRAQPPPRPAPTAGANPGAPSREAAALAEPFVGITADGKVQPGLFAIRATGVSTAPVQEAAAIFLGALTVEQRNKTKFPVDDIEWRKWMNVHRYTRQGVNFLEMSEAQRTAAFGLLRASLSAKGLKLSQDIMKLNHTLGELNHNNFVEYGEWLYHLTVMGEPSATTPWGWQIDGHHLIINYFVLGDQVVMSPVFVGSEPVVAPSGKYQGLTILQEEQNRGRDLLLALDAGQRKQAVLEAAKPGNNNQAEGFKDNVVIPSAGLRAAELNAAQRQQLLDLIALYVANMDDGHAKVRMSEVRAHLEATRFAWIGGSEPDSVYYYRIHSPVLLIEFDHQRPANLRHLAKNPSLPNREHIHVVVRTPNGNDYGKDLLQQHLLAHPH